MSFSEDYRKYRDNYLRVVNFRRRNFLYHHIFSVPYQWVRNYHGKKVLNYVKGRTDYPDLAKEGNPDIVVSLTTFPFRAPHVHLAIRSLLLQHMLPGKICLWVSDEEFPDGVESLSAELRGLVPNGLEINFVPANMRSHLKYCHVFERYSDKVVVTVDDDCIYSPDMISGLWRMHRMFSNAVCANAAKKITFDDGGVLSYRQWVKDVLGDVSMDMDHVAMGYGGVLYPPHIYDGTVLDDKLFRELSPLADDLWLKAVQMKLGVKVAAGGGPFPHPVRIPESQGVRLANVNVGQNKNDEQWQSLDRHFGLTKILRNAE